MYGVIFYLTNITTKMKRITAGGIILGTIFLAACNHAQQNGSYYVSGIVTNPQMEGRAIYLQDAIHSTTRYDSTQVINYRFALEGKIDSPKSGSYLFRKMTVTAFLLLSLSLSKREKSARK